MAREARPARVNWRFLARVTLWLAILVSTAVAAREVTRFAEQDAHFVLPGPMPVRNTPYFTVEGVVYASRQRIVEVFARDFGQSVFRMRLDERRRRLLAVDWVQDASISRIWPNRIRVRIRERKPVAFVSVPQGRMGSRIALIDVEGVILTQPPKAKFSFPIVNGLREEQPETERAGRVAYLLELQRDLGPLALQISEIDLTSTENLKITVPVEGRAVDLIIGDRNFASRCRNFLSTYPEIRKRSPNATLFDLRLDDRITAKEGDGG
jgi:cell division protein FtsQ